MAPVRVAINMSAQQFRQKNLVSIVKSALENANLEPTLSGNRADRERGHAQRRRVRRAFSNS